MHHTTISQYTETVSLHSEKSTVDTLVKIQSCSVLKKKNITVELVSSSHHVFSAHPPLQRPTFVHVVSAHVNALRDVKRGYELSLAKYGCICIRIAIEACRQLQKAAEKLNG